MTSSPIGPPPWEAPHAIIMEDWTVILRRPDGRLEFEHVEAESFALERDPLSKNSRIRYYVLRDSDHAEVHGSTRRMLWGSERAATSTSPRSTTGVGELPPAARDVQVRQSINRF